MRICLSCFNTKRFEIEISEIRIERHRVERTDNEINGEIEPTDTMYDDSEFLDSEIDEEEILGVRCHNCGESYRVNEYNSVEERNQILRENGLFEKFKKYTKDKIDKQAEKVCRGV